MIIRNLQKPTFFFLLKKIICRYHKNIVIGILKNRNNAADKSQLVQLILIIKQIMSGFLYVLMITLASIVSVSSLSTLQFTFNNSADSVYRYPTYYLGYIPGNSTIYFSISAVDQKTDLSNSVLQLLIGSSNNKVTTFSCSGITCSDTYYIASDQKDAYSFRIYSSTLASLLPPAFTPYYLIVNWYPGQPTTQQYPPNTEKLVKVTDALRIGVNKYIYIEDYKEIRISILPIPAALIGPDEAFRLVWVSPENGWTMDYANSVSLVDKGLVNGVYRFAGNVSKGYYVLIVTYDINTAPMKISWQTDLYACNYSQPFTDYFSIFQGCFFNKLPSPQGPPCLAYDPPTLTCKSCMSNFFLNDQGFCIANVTCPSRQYFHFGQCLPVSSLCGDFDMFTGVCLTCADQTNHYLLNGTCINKVIICEPRQYVSNLTCINVSPDCDNFHLSNGNCISCLNSTYFRVIEGICKEIKVQCMTGYYAVGLNCFLIPSQCLNFDMNKARCIQCITGYLNQDGTCTKIICPARYYFSLQTAKCTEVSSLCLQYDLTNGNCMSCSVKGYSVYNGQCIQSISPLAGCAERQQLGFGPCVNASVNCKIYNLITGNCDKCVPNRFLDYTGHCSEQANCSNGYWSVNGGCLRFPQNCLRIDDVGLCIECINPNYRITLGQCVYTQSCAARQFLNSAQQCVNVDPDCDQFNPSNGECITCLEQTAILSGGFCCSIGKLNLNRRCIEVLNNAESVSSSKCMLYHPTLRYCIRCGKGYKLDFPTGGCQNQ